MPLMEINKVPKNIAIYNIYVERFPFLFAYRALITSVFIFLYLFHIKPEAIIRKNLIHLV